MYKINLHINTFEDDSTIETIFLPIIPRKGEYIYLYDQKDKLNYSYEVSFICYNLDEKNVLESVDVNIVSD